LERSVASAQTAEKITEFEQAFAKTSSEKVNGTITEFTPGSTIVLKETTGSRTYHFGKTVTYVTKSGRTLDEDAVRTKIKAGVPVHVHYVGEGDKMVVDRVILDED
jgi:hypothetical protein